MAIAEQMLRLITMNTELMPAATRFKARVLTPLFLVVLTLVGGFIGGFYWEKHRDLDRDFGFTLRNLENSFNVIIENHAKRLAVGIDTLTENESLVNAFLLQDRTTLHNKVQPIFEKLQSDYGVTHLYFVHPTRRTFLRAHQPELFGEILDRQTLLAAERNEKLSYGIELGSTGVLSLRVVAPWYNGKNLIGYIELSEEIAQIFGQVKEIFGIEFYVALKQSMLDPLKWKQAMRALGRDGVWNTDSDYAIVAQTMPGTPSSLVAFLDQDHPSIEQITFTAASGKRRFHIGTIALSDVSGREVGKIAVLHDITAAMDNVQDVVRYATLVAGGLGLLLMALFYEILLRTERSVNATRESAAPSPLATEEREPEAKTEPDVNEDAETPSSPPQTISIEALYDRLTGLPINAVLHDRLNHEITVAQRDNKPVAVMVLRITNLGEVADSFGDELSNRLMQEISRRTQESVRRSDTVGRLGVNDLGIILPSVTPEIAVTTADKILSLLGGNYQVGSVTLDGKFASGMAIFPYHGHDAEVLLDRAENARRLADQSQQRFGLYDSRKESQKHKQVSLLTDFQRAINANDIMLHYLPRVDIASGKVNGAEALIRWRHAEQGHITSEDIIALAEKSGMIKTLTRWIVNKAFRQQASWRKSGIDLNLSINVTTSSLLDKNFYDYIRELQTGWKIPASSITFEIPEKNLLDDRRRITNAMERLHTMGFLLALDDVGVGHSAAPYLKTIPVAELKVHENIIYTVTENSNNFAFLRSTIDFAHGLGILVTAEGVKNKAIWDVLTAYHCDMAQGHHINQPSTSGAFECWLTNSKYGLGRKDSICTWRPEL